MLGVNNVCRLSEPTVPAPRVNPSKDVLHPAMEHDPMLAAEKKWQRALLKKYRQLERKKLALAQQARLPCPVFAHAPLHMYGTKAPFSG